MNCKWILVTDLWSTDCYPQLFNFSFQIWTILIIRIYLKRKTLLKHEPKASTCDRKQRTNMMTNCRLFHIRQKWLNCTCNIVNGKQSTYIFCLSTGCPLIRSAQLDKGKNPFLGWGNSLVRFSYQKDSTAWKRWLIEELYSSMWAPNHKEAWYSWH